MTVDLSSVPLVVAVHSDEEPRHIHTSIPVFLFAVGQLELARLPGPVKADLDKLGLCPRVSGSPSAGPVKGFVLALRPPEAITRRLLRALRARRSGEHCWALGFPGTSLQALAQHVLGVAVRQIGFVAHPETTAWIL